jgi:hypothetical protein
MTCRKFAFMLLLCSALFLAASAQISGRKGPIIRQVDHILVESSDPESLFKFFSDTLQLPEAWPLTENQGFVSGGVGTGNASIRFYRPAESGSAPTRDIAEARYAGLALQPYPLTNALRELQICKIPYDDPEPYISTLPNGSSGTLWTTVSLPSFSRPGMTIFLYEYSPAFLRVEARRQQLGNRLALNNGGPLGIQSIGEIVIAAKNAKADRAAWKQLLEKKTTSGTELLEPGPSIHLNPGSEDGISEIAFTVKSLARAKEFLDKHRLLKTANPRSIALDPSKVQGLKIRLME